MSTADREAAALEVMARNGRRAIDVLREQLAPKATDAELEYLGQVGQRLGLDPIAGHVVLIERWDSRLGRAVHRPTVTAEGRLVLAERTGAMEGYDGPEWTAGRDKTGTPRWVDVWDDDEPPHAARVIVYRTGWRPTNGTVRWAEFAQRGKDGKLLPTWAQMPSHMLAKTALSLGLRRAFPGVVPTDADLDDDLADAERAPALAPPEPQPTPPAGRRGQAFLPVDADTRVALVERAELLRRRYPPAADWLLREWRRLGGPQLSAAGVVVSAVEGDCFRRLLEDAERIPHRPEASATAWVGVDPGEQTDETPPDDVDVETEHEPRFDHRDVQRPMP